jgi:hypothetical protein
MNQRDLPGQLARWAVILSEFDFMVQYLPGEHNILPDALSRLYNFDEPGTARAPSEYVEWDVTSPPPGEAVLQSMPVLVGKEALALTPRRSARVAGKSSDAVPAKSAGRGELLEKVTPARPPVSEDAGKAESGAEFARRMRGRFVLKGPREPGIDQGGGSQGTYLDLRPTIRRSAMIRLTHGQRSQWCTRTREICRRKYEISTVKTLSLRK